MASYFAVGIGGFLGSCLRFMISGWIIRFSLSFPLGTLIANVIAGFFIGFIIGAEQNFIKISPNTKLFLTTGLLGGLSTFSAFSLETVELFKAQKYMLSVANIAANLTLSLCGVVLGFMAAKYLWKGLV